jgi:hypothetical protein
MSFLSRLFSWNKPSLDPGQSYEFLIVANFEEEDAARRCEASLAHLALQTRVKGLENGRWNLHVTFTTTGAAEKRASIKDAVADAAAAHGGKIVMFTAS